MNRQASIGRCVMSLSHFVLAMVAVFCAVDLSGLSDRGHLLAPLSVYLTVIFGAVAMQFVGAAIPNMKFTDAKQLD